MHSCRVFPSSVSGWKSVLQKAVNSKNNSEIFSPPHFQAYCINPKTKQVISDLNYSSMLSARVDPNKKQQNDDAATKTRRSGVLVLLEPIQYREDNKNNNKQLPVLKNELRMYVTRRTSHLRTHKGEISFAGGKCDGDETYEQAAIREGIEEIGADPSKYDILGQLSRVYSFPSRSFVTPTVAIAKDTVVVDVDENICKDVDVLEPNKKDEQNISSSSCKKERIIKKKIHSSLDLSITSECEVETIESLDLCELLLSTEKHFFLDREWTPPNSTEIQRWMLPAFKTNEDKSTLWGLTGFVFCELLSRLAHTLQEEEKNILGNVGCRQDSDLTEFERDARHKLFTFFERSSKHYLDCMEQVIGLPPANQPVKFVNPYDTIKDQQK